MKRTSLLLYLGIIIFLFVAGFSGYKYWQISVLDQDLKKLESDLSSVNAKILTYEHDQMKEAIEAKMTIDSLEIIKWSKVIEDIVGVLPEKDLVKIISYSASSVDSLSMNIKTNQKEDEPYLNIADFIQFFDESEDFENNFVSSISSGTDDEGEEILSFSFSTSYIGDYDDNSYEAEIERNSEPEVEPEPEVESEPEVEEEIKRGTDSESEVTIERGA